MSEDAKTSPGLKEFFARIPARIFWAVLVVVLIVFAIISYTGSDKATTAQRTKSVTQQLRCLECEGLSVYDSDTQTSKSIAKDVARRVKEGQSNEKIFSYYEDVYGEFIRLAPTAKSGNWLIYFVPAFFIAVLVAAIVLSVRRNVTQKIKMSFWIAAGLIFVIGIGVFVNDSNSTEKKTQKQSSKTSEELLQQAVNETPNNGNYRSLAIVQFGQEDYINALKNFDKAAELDPADAESQAYAAYIVFYAGQYDQAMARAQAAVSANGQDVTALFFRGVIYLQIPQADPALQASNEALANKDFDAVIALAPNSEFATQIKELRSSTTTSSPSQ